MKTLIQTAASALLFATPLYVGPAIAANGLHCRTVEATVDGMRMEFQNASGTDIPGGATAHWRLSGVVQGDVSFSEPLMAGGAVTQDYIFENAEPTLGAACSVEGTG